MRLFVGYVPQSPWRTLKVLFCTAAVVFALRSPAVAQSLDVDGNGTVDVATDITYIARHLLGLPPVPPSFRALDPSIPPDSEIIARIDALGSSLDVDGNGRVEVSTDVVYVARYLLGLPPVPASFRVLDPTIPEDSVLTHRMSYPSFRGIVLIVPTDMDAVKLAWLPAIDFTTPPAAMRYDLYLSVNPISNPSPATLFTSVTGQMETVLTGLSAGTTYYLLIVAVDQDGNESAERDVRSVTTLAFPVQKSKVTPSQTAAELNLGMPTQMDATSLTFANAPGATPPTTGAVLAGPLPEGGYLRKIEDVTQSANAIVVGTSPASLGDAFDSMSITSQTTLFDVAAAAQSVSANAAAPKTAPISAGTGQLPSGETSSEMRWPNRLLVARQIDHSTTENGLHVAPEGPGRFELSSSADGAEVNSTGFGTGGFDASVSLTFEPQLITDAKWTTDLSPPFVHLQSGEVIARGTLTLDANASYNFTAAASFQKGPVVLLTRTYDSVYLVGGWPVYQTITLRLKAEVSGSASAAVNASADARASVTAEAGVVYDPGTGTWVPDQSLEFDSGVTVQLNVVGGVQAQLRLIPEITVQFYRIIAGILSVEPYVDASLTAEATLIALCAPIEMDTADLNLGTECFAEVDFNVPFVGTYPIFGRTKICGPYTVPLFSLPSATLTASGSGQPFDLAAEVTDGVHDPFRADSAQWDVSPSEAGVLAVDPSNPLRATLTCNQSAQVTVSFAGNGVLGPIARHCSQLDLDCLVTPTPSLVPTDTPTETPTGPTRTPTPTPTSTGPPDPPTPPGNGWGDVHFVTFDGLAYDFQAVGEFVLVRSVDDSLQVQIRTKPYGNSRQVSVISAAAFAIGGDTVMVAADGPTALRLNGSPLTLNGIMPLSSGGFIYNNTASGITAVGWPDGSQVRATRPGSYLDLKLGLAASRAGRVEGLLGNRDGNIANDLTSSTGTVYTSPLSRELLYDHFGESWRVSQLTSLFYYSPGETTDTFTDRSFPEQLARVDALPDAVRQQAEVDCTQAGVTDPILLNACVVDVGFTRDSGFAAGAADVMPPQAAVDVVSIAQPLKTGQTTSYGPGSDGDLDAGVARQYVDNGDGTITDTATGLMWEKKDRSGGIHDYSNTYTWGMTSPPYTMNGTMVTTFLATLNAGAGFAGHTDWRIPNVNELQSLANYQNVYPAVDTAFNAGCAAGCTVDGAGGTAMCSCTQSSYYWSSTTYQDFPYFAWYVYFSDGYALADNKSDGYYVRAVRGGSAVSIAQRLKTGQTTSYGPGSDGDVQAGVARQYVDNGDGTITDTGTGLMWEKKDRSGSIHDFGTTYTWGMTSPPYTMNGTMVSSFLPALNAAPCFAGHCDWRIPNVNELQSLANYQTYSPGVDTAFNTSCAAGCTVDGAGGTSMCSCTQSSYYWSSTTFQSGPLLAWFVSFSDGYAYAFSKSYNYYVRAVRGGA